MTAPAAPYEPDALDPTLYVRGVAHDVFRWMRENDPVHRDERNGLWVVSKYEDVSYVERQPELFCSGKGVRPKGGGADALSIVSMDDPEHARQRRLISRGFTGARITQLVDHIRELARGLIDDVAERGKCDFVDDIAKQLPLIVIAEMLGLGIDDRERLAHWSDTMMAGEGAEADDPRQAAAGEAWAEYITYLVGLLEERRAQPRDDLISVLLSSADAGAISFDEEAIHNRVREGGLGDGTLGLGADDLLAFLVLLLVAGNETTRNALSGGMLALSNFPEERAKLVGDLGLVNSATEEVLRYAGVNSTGRCRIVVTSAFAPRSAPAPSGTWMSGSRVNSSSSRILISVRARFAPRQKCGPVPNARWRFGARSTWNASGSSKTSASQFALG